MTKAENNHSQNSGVSERSKSLTPDALRGETLSDIFEIRKFCVYCRASPEFCKCNNQIKWVVWREIIEEDVRSAVQKLKEEFEKWGTELQELQKVSRERAIKGRVECPECRRGFNEIIDAIFGRRLAE